MRYSVDGIELPQYTYEEYKQRCKSLTDEHARMEKQLALALGYEIYVEKDDNGNDIEIPGWGDHVLASLIDEACHKLKILADLQNKDNMV
jgi:hypothetical protein